MEKNLLSMAQEIEQMRGELAKFEVRPWVTGMMLGLLDKTVNFLILVAHNTSSH
jgi:hypothetical protein